MPNILHTKQGSSRPGFSLRGEETGAPFLNTHGNHHQKHIPNPTQHPTQPPTDPRKTPFKPVILNQRTQTLTLPQPQPPTPIPPTSSPQRQLQPPVTSEDLHYRPAPGKKTPTNTDQIRPITPTSAPSITPQSPAFAPGMFDSTQQKRHPLLETH